jgi:hypothetical protein
VLTVLTGEIEKWFGINTDLHEIKRAKESLSAAQDRIRVAIKNTSLLLYTVDREMRYTWMPGSILVSTCGMAAKMTRRCLPSQRFFRESGYEPPCHQRDFAYIRNNPLGRPPASRPCGTIDDDPCRRSDHCADLGAGGGRCCSIPLGQAGCELLRFVWCGAKLGRDGQAHAHPVAACRCREWQHSNVARTTRKYIDQYMASTVNVQHRVSRRKFHLTRKLALKISPYGVR